MSDDRDLFASDAAFSAAALTLGFMRIINIADFVSSFIFLNITLLTRMPERYTYTCGRRMSSGIDAVATA